MTFDRLFQQFIYWGVWLIIPLIWEILIGLFSVMMVLLKYFFKKPQEPLDFYPAVTILIPLHNSQDTLELCLDSILAQEYPKERIEVFLIDNGSEDRSFDIFADFQAKHPKLRIWWYSSAQGKSKALNKGIFSSSGKYVINVDSDGSFDKNAVRNIVKRFENNPGISCMTGVILINPGLLRRTENKLLKTMRLCELFEYSESFLVGRNFQSMFNTMYTLAGAFSCFRKEVLLKTQMYNSETLGEDAHMTFQIRNFVGGRTCMCEDAFFYVDPVENLDKLYTQRQRWQRAELEVAKLFKKQHIGGILDFITKPPVRRLVSDHTLAFPKLIWIFAMIYLYFVNYPLNLLIGANVLLYMGYTFNSFCYLLVSGLYLKCQQETRSYLLKHWYICFILPVYRFVIYWIRLAGIINSSKTDSIWRTMGLSEELGIIRDDARNFSHTKLSVIGRLKKFINNG